VRFFVCDAVASLVFLLRWQLDAALAFLLRWLFLLRWHPRHVAFI